MTSTLRHFIVYLLFSSIIPLSASSSPIIGYIDGKPVNEASLMALMLSIESGNANVGEELCLSVTSDGFTNILGMQFTIAYESSVLEFKTITNIQSSLRIDEEFLDDNFGLPGIGSVPLGKITFVWDAPGARAVTIANGETLFDLCFTVKSTQATSVSITGSPTNIQIIDSSENPVDFSSEEGKVNDNGNGGGGPSFDTFTLDITDGSGAVGTEVCLSINAYKLTGILGMQFSINYDPNILEYKTLKNFNTNLRVDPEFLDDNFGLPGSGSVPNGKITFVWDAPGARPISIEDGGLLFDVCFTVKAATETTVEFSSSPTNIQIIDQNEQIITFSQDPGKVNSGAAPVLNANFTANKNSVKVGETVNFTDASTGNPTSWSWSFQGGTPATSTARNPSITYNTPGTYSVTLTATNATGSDVETKVNFITVSEDTGFDVFTVDITDALGDVNQEICLSIDAYKFPSVLGMQFTVNYDPDILEFTKLDNLNEDLRIDAEFLTDNFGLPGTGSLPLGKLTFVWDAPGARPVTFDDGEKLFDVCFKIKKKDKTEVDFSDSPTTRQIIDGTEKIVPFNGDKGVVNGIQPPTILSPATVTNVLCNGASTGAIDITVQGGTGTYTYQWSYQSRTTQDLTGIPSGNYTVTVTDSGSNFTSTATFSVTQPGTAIKIDNTAVTPANCFGQSDGQINITASGGTGTLTYAWNKGLPANKMVTGLAAAADYVVTIRDQNGCELVSSPIVVGQPDALALNPQIKNASCFGESDGAITLNVTGGTPNYSYNWSGSLPDNVTAQMNLAPANNYAVTVTDSKGCTAQSGNLIISQAGQLQISTMSLTPINNGNDGKINVSATGGTGTLTYAWTGPNNYSSTAQNIASLNAVGEYCVTISDANGCELIQCFDLFQKVKINTANSVITPACFEQKTGSVMVAVTGGMPELQYRWSTGATGPTLFDVGKGTYTVSITDGTGDQITGSFEVTEYSKIDITGQVTNVSGDVNGANGSIRLNISGGQSPYTVNWGSSTGMQLSNLKIGEYCATVTDQRGCQSIICANVLYDAPPLELSATSSATKCTGEATGSVTVNIQGGWPPFKLTFSDGKTTENIMSNSVTRNDAPAGNLNYTITDNAGSTKNGTVTVENAPEIVLSSINVLHDTEETGCGGSINLKVEGGSPGYTVTWNIPGTGPQIINLCETETGYIPTVKDKNGCTKVFDPIQVNTFSVSGEIGGTNCPEDPDGSITLTVEGGEAPYVYEWLDDRNQVISNLKDPKDLASGTYTLKISEKSGNTLSKVFIVPSTSTLALELVVLSDFNGFGVSCSGGMNGQLRAVGTNGKGNLMYEWTKDDVLVGTSATINGLSEGIYKSTVVDGDGCMVEKEVELTAPSMLELQSTVNGVSCPGSNDGEIAVQVSGGLPGTAYNFSWSNGNSGPRLTRLEGGSYSVTATDANGCTVTAALMVPTPDSINVELESQAATKREGNGCNGAIRAIVSGGTSPYAYKWQQKPSETGSVIDNECPGPFVLIVTDANGCSTASIQGEIENRLFPCLEDRKVLSPDGDGLNDNFVLFCSGDLVDNHLEIFNRWGQLVYEADNYDCSDLGGLKCWEGTTTRGADLPEGPYYYVLEYTDVEGQLVQLKGSVSLLRE